MNRPYPKIDCFINKELKSSLQTLLKKLTSQTILDVVGPLATTKPIISIEVSIHIDHIPANRDEEAIILGDADTAFSNQHSFHYLFPQNKDFTDFEGALSLIKDLPKLELINFYGLWAERFDHSQNVLMKATMLSQSVPGLKQCCFYNSDQQLVLQILNQGIHAFNQEEFFSLISPYPQNISLSGALTYPAKNISLPEWSGLGLSNQSTGPWTLECSAPIWKYLLPSSYQNL